MPKKKEPIKVIHSKLGKHKAIGLAWADIRTIAVDERLRGLPYLETVIHEIIHVQNPKWGEIMVEGKAKEMAGILWELGFRWTDLESGQE